MELDRDQLVTLYRLMLRARKLDELMVNGLKTGKMVGFYHSGQGEEAVPVGACTFNLREDDYVYPHHRGHAIGFTLARGVSPKTFVAMHYGRVPRDVEGPTSEQRGIFGISGTIGGAFPMALGWALTAKMNARSQVSICFFGDGSSGRGTLHESMNMASVMKLPVVWVCENNLYGQWMPIKDAFPREDIADLAHTYAMPGVVVDGQDVLAVHEAVRVAVQRAREGRGPSLVECKTYRYRAHAEGMPDVSHADPRPNEELEAWKQRDPILLFRNKLTERGIFDPDEAERIEAEVEAEVSALDEYAQQCPYPEIQDPAILDLLLYAGGEEVRS